MSSALAQQEKKVEKSVSSLSKEIYNELSGVGVDAPPLELMNEMTVAMQYGSKG